VERAVQADLTSTPGLRVPLRLWCLPIAGTVVYPLILNSYSAVAHAGADGTAFLQRLALFTVAAALMLAAFAVPCLALRSLLWLENSKGVETRFLRRSLHIAAATPPVYILALQCTAALGVSGHLNALWCGAWAFAAAAIWRHLRATQGRQNSRADSIVDRWIPTFRVAHGMAALTLLLLFLAAHLANHLAALWSVEAHQAVMKLLRRWYRATWVEPVILGSCGAMIATGLVLVGFHTRTTGDRFRTVQTATGAYLVAFMFAHTNAVLWGRSIHIETDWVFASGGPTGLLLGPVYYLIPYYPLAVVAVSTHVALGLRIVLLGHRIEPAAAARATYAISALGAVTAVLIATALLGVHVAG
jgi:hypothetical protein